MDQAAFRGDREGELWPPVSAAQGRVVARGRAATVRLVTRGVLRPEQGRTPWQTRGPDPVVRPVTQGRSSHSTRAGGLWQAPEIAGPARAEQGPEGTSSETQRSYASLGGQRRPPLGAWGPHYDDSILGVPWGPDPGAHRPQMAADPQTVCPAFEGGLEGCK
ncbi:hypothetical protein NDU88_005043 [Pleurodeles waltl]|uniref:Uncharacterized protein n=1 Tax=Pleurodeles waltl TaxID=8319 RepID=A0AAV7T9U8_PLEWA|nr:hypothetical protein NDU88_005043 [Pleurodeles waltl]